MIDPTVLQAYRNAVATEQYAMVYLAMAAVAYTDEADKDGDIIQKVTTAVEGLPQLPTPSGVTAPADWKWQVDLGPFYTSKNANLFYVASYQISDDGSDYTPVFSAVVVRGTDTSSTLEGVVEQLREDLDDFSLRSWQDILNGDFTAKLTDLSQPGVSHGTAIGLENFLSLPNGTLNGPSSLVAYLQSNFTGSGAYVGVPLVVTGHSLGACQAAALAPYLKAQVSSLDIYLHPFAPPTPGNAAFNNEVEGAVQNGYIWWNPLDIVPNAYWNLDNDAPVQGMPYGIVQHWKEYGGASCPDLLGGFIKLNKGHIDRMGFTRLADQSGVLNDRQLPGSTVKYPDPPIFHNDSDYVKELEYQHFPPLYSQLITQNEGSNVDPYPYTFG